MSHPIDMSIVDSHNLSDEVLDVFTLEGAGVKARTFARDELSAALKAVKNEVVTEVKSAKDKDGVPYWKQGDISMYNKENMRKRLDLKDDPEVRAAVDRWWVFLTDSGARTSVEKLAGGSSENLDMLSHSDEENIAEELALADATDEEAAMVSKFMTKMGGSTLGSLQADGNMGSGGGLKSISFKAKNRHHKPPLEEMDSASLKRSVVHLNIFTQAASAGTLNWEEAMEGGRLVMVEYWKSEKMILDTRGAVANKDGWEGAAMEGADLAVGMDMALMVVVEAGMGWAAMGVWGIWEVEGLEAAVVTAGMETVEAGMGWTATEVWGIWEAEGLEAAVVTAGMEVVKAGMGWAATGVWGIWEVEDLEAVTATAELEVVEVGMGWAAMGVWGIWEVEGLEAVAVTAGMEAVEAGIGWAAMGVWGIWEVEDLEAVTATAGMEVLEVGMGGAAMGVWGLWEVEGLEAAVVTAGMEAVEVGMGWAAMGVWGIWEVEGLEAAVAEMEWAAMGVWGIWEVEGLEAAVVTAGMEAVEAGMGWAATGVWGIWEVEDLEAVTATAGMEGVEAGMGWAATGVCGIWEVEGLEAAVVTAVMEVVEAGRGWAAMGVWGIWEAEDLEAVTATAGMEVVEAGMGWAATGVWGIWEVEGLEAAVVTSVMEVVEAGMGWAATGVWGIWEVEGLEAVVVTAGMEAVEVGMGGAATEVWAIWEVGHLELALVEGGHVKRAAWVVTISIREIWEGEVSEEAVDTLVQVWVMESMAAMVMGIQEGMGLVERMPVEGRGSQAMATAAAATTRAVGILRLEVGTWALGQLAVLEKAAVTTEVTGKTGDIMEGVMITAEGWDPMARGAWATREAVGSARGARMVGKGAAITAEGWDPMARGAWATSGAIYVTLVGEDVSSLILEENWHEDSKGQPSLQGERFFEAIFELADVWCTSVEAQEYVEFLNRCLWDTIQVFNALQMAADGGGPDKGKGRQSAVGGKRASVKKGKKGKKVDEEAEQIAKDLKALGLGGGKAAPSTSMDQPAGGAEDDEDLVRDFMVKDPGLERTKSGAGAMAEAASSRGLVEELDVQRHISSYAPNFGPDSVPSSVPASSSGNPSSESARTFQRIDTDGDGHLSLDELKSFMGSNDWAVGEKEGQDMAKVKQVFAEMDVDQDGRVTEEEWERIWPHFCKRYNALVAGSPSQEGVRKLMDELPAAESMEELEGKVSSIMKALVEEGHVAHAEVLRMYGDLADEDEGVIDDEDEDDEEGEKSSRQRSQRLPTPDEARNRLDNGQVYLEPWAGFPPATVLEESEMNDMNEFVKVQACAQPPPPCCVQVSAVKTGTRAPRRHKNKFVVPIVSEAKRKVAGSLVAIEAKHALDEKLIEDIAKAIGKALQQ
eukprot:gene12913-15263_t